MAKKESSFTNMVLTLFVVSLIASAALGGVFVLTEEPITQAMTAKKNLAIKRVVPDFDNQPSLEYFSVWMSKDSVYFYPAKQGDEIVGYAIETFTNNGFGGKIKLLAGFKPDGTVYNIAVLEHKETPGLGTKMMKSEDDWSVQFNGRNPGDYNMTVTKDGGEIDAITASTITSRAFCEAVQTAYDALMKEGGAK